MADEANRWELVYRTKEEGETSWFKDRPQLSLDLIAETGATKNAAIIDVGAGSSRLVDCLLKQRFHRITVLDLSGAAEHTAVSFRVDDIREAVTALKASGVEFADYDLPGLKTVDHVCVLGSEKAVWFSDPEGNLLCLHEDLGGDVA